MASDSANFGMYAIAHGPKRMSFTLDVSLAGFPEQTAGGIRNESMERLRKVCKSLKNKRADELGLSQSRAAFPDSWSN